MAQRGLFATINKILDDSVMYSTRRKNGLPIKSDMVLQSDSELQFAGALLEFLREGSYLPKGKKGDNARRLMSIKGKRTASALSKDFDMSLRQIYSASDLVEEQLNVLFPTGLLTLWNNREFDVIKQFMSLDKTKTTDLLFYLNEGSETLAYADNLFSIRSSISMPELKGRLGYLDKEFVDSCVRAKETLDSVRALVGTAQSDLYNLFYLIKLLENDMTLPVDVYTELVLNDPLGIFKSEMEEDELDSFY